MTPQEGRLGRGLESLLPRTGEEIVQVSVDEITPNPYQPRSDFPEEELRELAASIRQNGILQPVILRRAESGYQLVAGERRWRAAKIAGMAQIPAIVRTLSDPQLLEIALVENIQRQDLNPIEKARAVNQLMEDLGATQQEIADRIGQARSSVANLLRLLDLPKVIQEKVSRGTISMGHARALLSLEDEAAQISLAEKIEEHGLSVRDVEKLVSPKQPKKKGPKSEALSPDLPPNLADIQERLRRLLGTKVSIQQSGKKGKLVIEYYGLEDLDRILQTLNVSI